MLHTYEENIASLYPIPTEYRAHQFELRKRIVFITARVHPGETQASHVWNGIINFLLSKDPRAKLLRDQFVFKIVPIVNPDGVARGNFRTDQNGINLNRVYSNPSVYEWPTVFAIKRLFVHYSKLARDYVYCYFDLHGHTSKRGWFVYGNSMDYVSIVEAHIIPKLFEINWANFDYRGSQFHEKNMNAQNTGEKYTKEGCARVALYRATSMARWYTLEWNYNTGMCFNKLVSTGLTESNYQNTDSDVYRGGTPVYTPELFEDVGKGLWIAVLDSTGKNPNTRVKNTPYVNLSSIRYEIAERLAQEAPFRYDRDIKKMAGDKEKLLAYIGMT